MTPPWPADDRITRAVMDCLRDGSWARYDHDRLENFELMLADSLGAAHAVLAGSGTQAMEHALAAVEISAGARVALSAYDFPGNFLTIHALGAHPVLVDADPATGQMDPASLETNLRQFGVSAVVVSHLHGGVADLPAILSLCQRHGAALIEDCCQSPGAVLNGRMLGTWGRAGVVGFGGGKPVSCGRGGAVVSNDPVVAQRIRLRSQRGTRLSVPGNLQLAALTPQLAILKETMEAMSAGFERLRGELGKSEEWSMLTQTPKGTPGGTYRLGLMSVSAESRQRQIDRAKAMGLPVEAGFRAIHAGRASGRYEAADALPGATECGKRMMTLPGDLVRHGRERLDEILSKCRDWVAGH